MFTDERLRQDIDELADQIRLSMIAETARWGSRSYTPDVWESAITWMRDRYAPAGRSGRAATVVRQLRQAGLFPNFNAPEPQINGIAQYGGDVALGDRLTLTATSGVVYYTLNGVDPRLPGGALHPDAQLFSGDPLVLNATTSVKTRSLARWAMVGTGRGAVRRNRRTCQCREPAD